MFKKKIWKLTMFVSGVFCFTGLTAQQFSDSIWYDIDYIRLSDTRITSSNATGLRYLPIIDVSQAKLFVQKDNGDFVNFYQSDNSYDAGAEIESYYRLDSKIVFYGKISYDYFKGKNMGGSYFLHPGYNPIDIQQTSDSTNGNKVKETYHLRGGVSVDLTPRLTLGGLVGYEVGNYTKQKDLRNVNKFLDLVVTVGASYELTKNIEIGANYFFNRNVESLNFLTAGNSDKDYISLISIGNFIGQSELFDRYAQYTSSGSTRPMINKYQGGAIQLNLKLSDNWSFFNNISYKSRKGNYGEPSSSTVVLTEHSSNIFGYKGEISLKRNKYQHVLSAEVDYEKLDNKENVYKDVSSNGELSNIKYFGTLDLLERKEAQTKIRYNGFFDVVSYNPKWELNAGFDYFWCQQTATLFPFYRKQTVNNYKLSIGGKHNVRLDNKSMIGISLSALYAWGDGTPMYDGVYMDPTSSQKDLYKTNDDYLYQEYEYLTNEQFGGTVGIRYSRTFIKEMRNYVQVDYSFTKASEVKYIKGDFFNTIGLTIGCVF